MVWRLVNNNYVRVRAFLFPLSQFLSLCVYEFLNLDFHRYDKGRWTKAIKWKKYIYAVIFKVNCFARHSQQQISFNIFDRLLLPPLNEVTEKHFLFLLHSNAFKPFCLRFTATRAYTGSGWRTNLTNFRSKQPKNRGLLLLLLDWNFLIFGKILLSPQFVSTNRIPTPLTTEPRTSKSSFFPSIFVVVYVCSTTVSSRPMRVWASREKIKRKSEQLRQCTCFVADEDDDFQKVTHTKSHSF